MRQWSNSRESLLLECERKYCFTYESNARRNSRDPILRRIAELKSIKSIAMWKGDLIHEGVASWWSRLANGREIPLPTLKSELSRVAESRWNASKGHASRGEITAEVLFEHMQGSAIGNEILDEAIDEAHSSLEVFLSFAVSSGAKNEFLRAHRRWVEPLPYGPEATSFITGKLQVTTKVDLAIETPLGSFIVYDWKTGRDDADHDDQMDLYILWPHLTLGIPLERIEANVVNLRSGSIYTRSLDEFGKRARLAKLHRSSSYLESLVPRDTNWPEMLSAFNYSSHLSTCRRCQFQQLCGELE